MTRPPILNRRLVLEAPVRVPDGSGGFSETWNGLGSLWADVSVRNGGERPGEELALARVSYRILVRAAPHGAASRPQPGQRFREGARIFRIRAVAEADRRGQYLTCFADEEMAA